MAYCTSDHVLAEFKSLNIGAGTAVSTTDVTRFIEEADATIDSFLSQRYMVPITGSSALIFVRNISIMLVAQRVKDILKVKSGTDDANQDGRGNLKDYAIKMLNDVVMRKINLNGATLADSADGVSSYVSSNEVPFIFDRDTEQW